MELRQDPITGRWVIVAEERADRPQAFVPLPPLAPDADCPFCPGREDCTPGELLAFRVDQSPPNTPGWRVRVVPNKFPALSRDVELLGDAMASAAAFECSSNGDGAAVDYFERSLPAYGAHEVIIESARHIESLTELDDDELIEVFVAYQNRLISLRTDTRLRHALVFKNVGRSAGASLAHTHSQIMALAVVPPSVQAQLDRSLDYFARFGRCVYCDLIERERARGARVVEETDELVVLCPYASRLPLEMWIMPRVHASRFEQNSPASLAHLAHVVRSAVGRLEAVLGRVAYNHIIHTSPFDMLSVGHYHWRIEVMPRLTRTAGFEWGSGCYINPVPPEQAAAMLRERVLAARLRK